MTEEVINGHDKNLDEIGNKSEELINFNKKEKFVINDSENKCVDTIIESNNNENNDRADNVNEKSTISGDSENKENDFISNNNKVDDESKDDSTLVSRTYKKHVINSDSEDDDNDKFENDKSANKIIKKCVMYSDSENEDDKVSSKLSSKEDHENSEEVDFTLDDQSRKNKSRLLQLCDSDSEEETKITNVEKNSIATTTIFQTDVDLEKEQTLQRLKTLCDSESSTEETEEISEHISTKNIMTKRRTKPIEHKEKKMSGKEALELRREIQSESQKMVRERRVHLPYHRPKQHTLQEFLNRRSILSNTIKVPPNTPTSLCIKMSSEQIKLAEQKFKEREKEIEEFYKLDDEPETKDEEQINGNDNTKDLSEDNEKQSANINEFETLEGKSEEMEVNEVDENIEKNDEEIELEIHREESKIIEQKKISEENVIKNIEKEKSHVEDISNETNGDKDEELKELREILEKKLPYTESITDNKIQIETEQSESNLAEQSLNLDTENKNIKEKENKLPESIIDKLKKINPVLAMKLNFQPKLSGNPNDIIDLDEDIDKCKNVNNLMERFAKHAIKKPKYVENSILNTGRGLLNIESEISDEQTKTFQIPGAKMKKLKMELEERITKQRLEEWKKRQELTKLENEEEDIYIGEKGECRLNDKVLDNEEEDELTDLSSTSSESEEEEDDIEIKENPRIKSAFFDDEAEESDPDDFEPQTENEIDDDEVEIEENEKDDEEADLEPPTQKSLRRIIKPFTEDSDDETLSRSESLCENQRISNAISTELFTSQNLDDNEEDIPAYQLPSDNLEKTPNKIATQSKNDLTAMLTPTFHLTALQGMNSATKLLQESPNVNSFFPVEISPLKSHDIVRTKLFTDRESFENNLDELENLCSGKFTTTQPENKNDRANKEFSTQENELFNICSGKFSGFSQNDQISSVESSLPIKTSLDLDLLSNELSFKNDTSMEKLQLEEDLNEKCDKIQEKNSAFKLPKMVIASSSEDDKKDDESLKKKKKLTKKRKRYIIDDISITDEDELDEEPLKDEESLEDEEESKTTNQVNYDSEENEIEYEEIDEVEKPVRKTADFFEAEAELSGSEWGSEDEDERNLDDYEIEEGDTEKINEKKVQQQLERMHMRNMLDEDQREVKLLQELLLEDGELHGSGRERKFRWKNANLLSWNTETDIQKDDEEVEELESELQWRKMRHEREMFLKEQEIKQRTQQNDDELLNDSQIMKLGQEALRKSLSGSQSQQKTPITEVISKTDDIKLPFALTSKRGSFLARSETTLTKLAEITKISNNLNRPKNSKNFLFTAVEKTEIIEEDIEINLKKRKAVDGTPKALKKIRIADMSPAVQKRKK